jgi:hypothetical protein
MSNPLSRREVLGGLFAAVASVLHETSTAPAPEQLAPPTAPAGQGRYSYADHGSRSTGYDPKWAALYGETITLTFSSAGLGAVEPLRDEPKPGPNA